MRRWKFRVHGFLYLALFLIAVLFSSSIQLYAQETNAEPGPEKQLQEQNVEQPSPPDYEYTEPEFGGNKLSYPILVLRTIAVLAVIIIGIYLLFRFLLKKRNPVRAESEIIRVLSSLPLSANKAIQVVEIAEKILVLGVSDSNINLITTIEDKETIDKIRLISSKESKGTGSFKEQFLKLIGGKTFPKSTQISYFNSYRKRINRMKKL